MQSKNKIEGWDSILVFAGIFTVALVIYDNLNAPMDAKEITEIILDDNAVSFANEGIIDESRLQEIKAMDYHNFKKSLNAKNDFCIYMEDEKGNVILAKGSSRLNGDGIHCEE